MTATPWPHGWRAGMVRIRPTTGQSWRARRGWDQEQSSTSLRWSQEPGGRLSDSQWPWPRDVPDLDDGPTKGALLDMVREKAGDPYLVAHHEAEGFDGFEWVVFLEGADVYPAAPTEGLALKAALDHTAALDGDA